MLFNSWVFPLFLLLVWVVYRAAAHRAQNIILLIASYVFYAWWDWRFLSLLWVSTVVDFLCARAIDTYTHRRRWFLVLSLMTNLGILGFFKYFNFFAQSAERLLHSLGLQPDFFTLSIILPVGISFYTFQTLSYTIDVYRGKQQATRDMLSFAVYVAYFPQLVAGPIERSINLLPAIQSPRRVTREGIYTACPLLVMGYFKKVFIADGVAPLVNHCFGHVQEYGAAALYLGSILFALQIYGDFSGYTDIARGVSRLFGIELCLNFRQPYLSPNITEFWRRWHMSLSTWLRDYLYIPLGGNRKGRTRMYVNNMITMLLGGLWHGAGWHFVAWGGLHGLYLAAHKWMAGRRFSTASTSERAAGHPLLQSLKIIGTFNLVCLTWIFFRSDSLAHALDYGFGMVHNPLLLNVTRPLLYVLFYGLITFLVDALCWAKQEETPFAVQVAAPARGAMYAGMLFLMATVGSGGGQPFIYFQF